MFYLYKYSYIIDNIIMMPQILIRHKLHLKPHRFTFIFDTCQLVKFQSDNYLDPYNLCNFYSIYLK